MDGTALLPAASLTRDMGPGGCAPSVDPTAWLCPKGGSHGLGVPQGWIPRPGCVPRPGSLFCTKAQLRCGASPQLTTARLTAHRFPSAYWEDRH